MEISGNNLDLSEQLQLEDALTQATETLNKTQGSFADKMNQLKRRLVGPKSRVGADSNRWGIIFNRQIRFWLIFFLDQETGYCFSSLTPCHFRNRKSKADYREPK